METSRQNAERDEATTEPVIDIAAGRRAFLQTMAVGALGTAVVGASTGTASAQTVSTADVLNFALNLEYLEAEFYLTAIGTQLSDAEADSPLGPAGAVSRGHKVPFADPIVSKVASEIAGHERTHVNFLRGLLGSSRVARPAIDVNQSFTTAARAAGLIGPNATFDAYANDTNFLLASFIFEDVGVTAYQGAAQFLSGQARTYAAGILAVEAYHAGIIRTLLYERNQFAAVQAISDLRDMLDLPINTDVGIGDQNSTTLVPVDGNATTFPRAVGQVLNVVYGAAGRPTSGLFFPNGTNGTFRTAG